MAINLRLNAEHVKYCETICIVCSVWRISDGLLLNTLIHHCEAVLHLRFQDGIMVTCSKVNVELSLFNALHFTLYWNPNIFFYDFDRWHERSGLFSSQTRCNLFWQISPVYTCRLSVINNIITPLMWIKLRKAIIFLAKNF